LQTAASRSVPEFEYLRTASRSLLQSFELSRLNQAANIQEEIATLIDQWVEQTAELSDSARWMLDHHSSFHPAPSPAQRSCAPSSCHQHPAGKLPEPHAVLAGAAAP
jgi:hypothetical protein